MQYEIDYQKRVNLVEDIIKAYLPEEIGTQRCILEAMNYSILAGGKRLRPILMLETSRLFGGNDDYIKPFVAAIEMIHTSSLVHDDLPALDNDEYRRGKKTTHAVYGEDIGILAGDGLINYAYEICANELSEADHISNYFKALKTLGRKSGIYGMLGGQAVDVSMSDKPIDKDQLEFIYKLKTGALIEAAMMIGAIMAGAADEQVAIIEQIAGNIGMAFQIQDDILDVTSSIEVLGKPVLSDEKNNKTTYVSLFGLDKAKQKVECLSNDAIKKLNNLNVKNEFLEQLLYHLIKRLV